MTCPRCQAGETRIVQNHVRVSERGIEVLGPCLAPEESTKSPEFPFRERLAEWTERMNRDCHKHIPLPVSPEAEVLTHWTEKAEEDEP